MKELKYINVELTKEFPVLYGHGEMVNLKKIKNYQQLLNISDTQNYCFIYFTVTTLNIDGRPKPFFVPYFMFKEQIVGLNELKKIKIALRTKYIQSNILSDARYCT